MRLKGRLDGDGIVSDESVEVHVALTCSHPPVEVLTHVMFIRAFGVL